MVAIFQGITAFSVIGILGTFTGSIIGCIGACCDRGNDVSRTKIFKVNISSCKIRLITIKSSEGHP